MHIVEVSDSARDRLQGLHHCFFGRRTSSRLQLLEVCEPLSQCQQQFRLVWARDGLGKPLVKCCRVLICARKGLFVQHSRDRAAGDRSAPRRYSNTLSSMSMQISCLDRSAGCPRTFLTSSVSNSGLITFVHVLNWIANQCCHALAGGKPRDPVGAGILARLTRETSGSRAPANILSGAPFSLRLVDRASVPLFISRTKV